VGLLRKVSIVYNGDVLNNGDVIDRKVEVCICTVIVNNCTV
jgi:hypothetical protein